MNKTTEKAVELFVNNKPGKTANTEIIVSNNKTTMFLHDNAIAILENGKLTLDHCGWKTKTTKERLNGILDRLNLDRIYQKNYQWYVGDKEWTDRQFSLSINLSIKL